MNEQFSRAILSRGLTLFSGPALANALHRHCPATLITSLDGAPIETRTQPGGTLRGKAMLVAPGTRQATDTGGRPFVDLLIDPDHPLWPHLRGLLCGAAGQCLDEASATALAQGAATLRYDDLDCARALAVCDELVAQIAAPAQPLDPRILAAAQGLREAPGPELPDSASLAREAGLSRSHFLQLWKREIGSAPRDFALWTRLSRAAVLWKPGMQLTELALEAGFYDLAHFSRNVRKMFELSPSSLVAALGDQSLRVQRCGRGSY